LADAGWAHIPVISLSAQGFEKNPGFKITIPLLIRALRSVMIGDLLMRVLYRTRPYEAVSGSANALYEKWNEKAQKTLKSLSVFKYNRLVKNIVREFDELPLLPQRKPRIGVVGEILVKFHPTANNDIFSTIEREGADVIIAGAGLAAALPGVIAGITVLPVIGVPLESVSEGSNGLAGFDALLSIVQMPPQIPVATVGIGNAKNAAYLALEILALKYPEIKTKLMEFRKKLAEEAALQGGNGVSL